MSSPMFRVSLALLLSAAAVCLRAQAPPPPDRVAQQSASARTEQAYNDALKRGPLALRAFLERMPKGADLHMHLSGAVYAETWLREAAEDRMCVQVAKLRFDREAHAPNCPAGERPAADAQTDQDFYNALVDAFSMRTFVPVSGESGHDHFFATFDRFGGVSHRHRGEWLDEVATRAARQNEQYLEIMETPSFTAAAQLAAKIGEEPDVRRSRDRMIAAGMHDQLPVGLFRDRLLAAGLRDELPAIEKEFADAEKDRRAREHCDTQEPAPGCRVVIRFLFQVLRGISPTTDLAQMILADELISADPQFVGLNLVRAEDWLGPLENYRSDMADLAELHQLYPAIHLSLHAGELAEGLVPPDELRYHINFAVLAGAERIGHGADIMYENHPEELLSTMAVSGIAVEINLTSNDLILGLRGADQPLPEYLRAHVPVTLSTDDEGVSRIDLTHEYVRAAATYQLTYPQLVQMARASLEHSFLPGASLWESTSLSFNAPALECAGQLEQPAPTGACATLVSGSEKAQQQWEYEQRLRRFERGLEPQLPMIKRAPARH